MLRKLALQLPLLFVMLFAVTAQSNGQSSSRAFADFSYLRNDLRTLDQKIEDFIADVRAGSRQAFKYVEYETIEGAIVRLRREADDYPATRTLTTDRVIKYLVATTADDEEQARQILTRATLPGIFNMDPRVRLCAADWLRGIRPDESMQRAVKLAVGVDIEVIRYDHQRGEFVFRAPRILETVASAYEYYREKDIDWPTSVQVNGLSYDPTTGVWETHTGNSVAAGLQPGNVTFGNPNGGANDDPEMLYMEAPQLRDNAITTGLSARRWGDFSPRYDEEEGYVPVDFNDPNTIRMIFEEYQRAIDEASASVIARFRAGDIITVPTFNQYRHYPVVEDGISDERRHAQLLMDQFYIMGEMIPLGQGDKYVYLTRNCQVVIGNPWAELTKLDMFITRKIWWAKIVAGERNVMTYLSKDTFATLFRSIDGEIPEYIPMLSFATNQPMLEQDQLHNATVTARIVDTLIEGLHRNPVLSNRYVMLRTLKHIYVDYFEMLDVTPQIRETINIALWEFRREANRLDLVVGRELMAESLTVGLRPEDDFVPIEPLRASTFARARRDDLGFRRPNDEIRAVGYELITMDTPPTVSVPDALEPRVNLYQRYKELFYKYRRGDGRLITWYDNQAEWYVYEPTLTIPTYNTCDTALLTSHDIYKRSNPWMEDTEQMDRAQTIIDNILAGNGEMMTTLEWRDLESAIILTLWRTWIQHQLHGATTLYTTFMDMLQHYDVIVPNTTGRTANQTALNDNSLTTQPEWREDVFVNEYCHAQTSTIPSNTYSEQKREAIKEAALGGLLNRDPRVRLTATHFLRRLGPDESMLDAVLRARSIASSTDLTSVAGGAETDDNLNQFIDTNIYERVYPADSDYSFIDIPRYRGAIPEERLAAYTSASDVVRYQILNPCYTIANNEYQLGVRSMLPGELSSGATSQIVRYYGLYQWKSPGEELDKLYRFIQRERLVAAIRRDDVNAVTRMSRTDFGILSEFIDHEYAARVPFMSFHWNNCTSTSFENRVPSEFAIFDEEDIDTIKRGIDSTNFLVQKGTAEFIIRFYNSYTGFEASDAVKREIRDAMYFYKQDDIVVEEFVLAFEGENPDGRAVIMAGTPLSGDLNPGGERVYRTLPDPILMDIRDAVLDETERLPENLRSILGLIGNRAHSADVTPYSR